MQLLVAEATVLAACAALGYGLLGAIPAVTVATIMIVATLARRNGRLWIERRVIVWQYHRRNRARTEERVSDGRLAALRYLSLDMDVQDIGTATDAKIGVARDGAGWYAVAVLASSDIIHDANTGAPLDLLVSALRDTGQPGVILQIVTHSIAANTVKVGSHSPADQSYAELLQRMGGIPALVDRVTWIAVRLDALALAEHVAESGSDGREVEEQVPATVAALLQQVVGTFRRAGVRARALDADGLLDALQRSFVAKQQLEPASRPREQWRSWHSGRLAHRSFWIKDWPPVTWAEAMLSSLSAIPAASTSVALTLVPERDIVDVRCLVRIAAPPRELNAACRAAKRQARAMRARLFPLDGEHGPAVYVSSPTAVGLR